MPAYGSSEWHQALADAERDRRNRGKMRKAIGAGAILLAAGLAGTGIALVNSGDNIPSRPNAAVGLAPSPSDSASSETSPSASASASASASSSESASASASAATSASKTPETSASASASGQAGNPVSASSSHPTSAKPTAKPAPKPTHTRLSIPDCNQLPDGFPNAPSTSNVAVVTDKCAGSGSLNLSPENTMLSDGMQVQVDGITPGHNVVVEFNGTKGVMEADALYINAGDFGNLPVIQNYPH